MQGLDLVGHKLRLLRQQAGLTTEELAVKAGIKKRYLINLEMGRDQPGLMRTYKLAHVLTECLGRSVDIGEFTEAKSQEVA